MEQNNMPVPGRPSASDPDTTARLLRMPDVLKLTGIKAASTLYDMIRRGEFPGPVKMGRMSYWPADAVHRWIDAALGTA